MSLTLKTAITATQTTIDVLGNDALSEGDIRQIDSEQLMVRVANSPARGYLETAYQRLTVFRGVAGTSKASHAANAGLTTPSGGGAGVSVTAGGVPVVPNASGIDFPVGTVSDAGSGVAAVAGTWRGPLKILTSTLPANGDFLHLLDLDPGQIVYAAYAISNVHFATGVTIGLAITKRGDPTNSAQFGNTTFLADAVDPTPDADHFKMAQILSTSVAGPFQIVGDSELDAYLDSGTLDADGDFDVYVLVGQA